MTIINFSISLEADPCIYDKNIEINNKGVITMQYLMVALYIDDLPIAVLNKNLATKLESTFEAKYKMKKLNVIKLLLGMGIFQDKVHNTIYIT
jgi:hypothetical protein